MDFAPGYLVQRFFYRVLNFFHHWYIDGSRAIGHRFISTLETFDQSLAIRITIKYFFQPLYRDFTVVGRVLGVVFRTFRIAIGFAIYAAVAVVSALFYAAWLAFPPIILYYAIRGL